MAGVEQIRVEDGEAGMRLDRWFKVHYPGLGFGHLQKLLRSGQIRVDGGRVKADSRVEPGQMVRVPPLPVDKAGAGPLTAKTIRGQDDGDVLRQMLLHEDAKVFVCSARRRGWPKASKVRAITSWMSPTLSTSVPSQSKRTRRISSPRPPSAGRSRRGSRSGPYAATRAP